LNRNGGVTRRAGAADIDQADDEAIDFRRIRFDTSSRSFVVEAASSAGADAMSRSAARDISIDGDDLRDTGIDQLNPVADFAKGVDTGGCC